jgi:hypothetical protein
MRSLTYESSTSQKTVNLSGAKAWVGTILDLRSRAFDYTLGSHGVSAVTRNARTVKLSQLSVDPKTLDEQRRIFDADMIAGKPGSLNVDVWSQRALLVESAPQFANPVTQGLDLTFVLLDGVWRKPVKSQYVPSVVTGGAGLDLPTDLPFDLSPMSVAAELVNEGLTAVPLQLRVYGPATNPYVVINGNRYQVDVVVPEGGYLTIDGIERSILLTSADGDVTDCFSKGHRGLGEGGGEYVFQRVPAGSNSVSWTNSFGFDVTLFLEEGEVPWSTL